MKYLWVCIPLLMVIGGCEKKDGVTVRPDNFPSFLQVPENGYQVRYATPENAEIVKGACSLSYFVDEGFPPEKAMDFMHQQLSSAGFIQLEYSYLQPLIKLSKEWYANKFQEPGYVYYDLLEHQANESYETVLVNLSYRYKVDDKQLDQLYVYQSHGSQDAESSKYIKRYMEYHPKEFQMHIAESDPNTIGE